MLWRNVSLSFDRAWKNPRVVNMQYPKYSNRLRTIAFASLALVATAVVGTVIAEWSVSDANGFYMSPMPRYGAPAYARRQPVADSFWQAQDGSDATHGAGYQATGVSTATSAQPAYLSASGS